MRYTYKDLSSTRMLKCSLLFTIVESSLIVLDYFLIYLSGNNHWCLELVELIFAELAKYIAGCVLVGIMWGYEVDFNNVLGAGTYGDNLKEQMRKKKEKAKKNLNQDLCWESCLVIGGVLTILLITLDKLYDIGGYSNDNRDMSENHRFGSKCMIGLILIKIAMSILLIIGYCRRFEIYKNPTQSKYSGMSSYGINKK